MLGTRLRSWMEAHIVRARKKQNKTKGKGKSSTSESSQINHDDEDSRRNDVQQLPNKSRGEIGRIGDSVCDKRAASMTSAGVQPAAGPNTTNLSSPESAYSTGYSTDGTSPGASIPPEYYINLRTGKHYVQANTGNTGTSEAAVQGSTAVQHVAGVAAAAVNAAAAAAAAALNGGSRLPTPPHILTPSSGRRRREERKQKLAEGLPESSTEEDIADRPVKTPHKITTPKCQKKVNHFPLNRTSHRRTESCDETQRSCIVDSEGSSSTQTGGSSHLNCPSPFLSTVTSSPRQRNRIRTNPWLGNQLTAVDGSINGKYNSSHGETSSTVGSSSTLSSVGAKDDFTKAIEETNIVEEARLNRAGTFLLSPPMNGKKGHTVVTTCSPLPNRPCRHNRGHSSSPSTSAASSGTDDYHRHSTSDFSDDDVTLNEMGKYDESYVYEKETDILSDSDPTDCEDDHRYRNGKMMNRGHCVYIGGQSPDVLKKQNSRGRRPVKSGECSAQSSRGSSASSRPRRTRRSNSSSSVKRPETAEESPKRYKKRRQTSVSSQTRSTDNPVKEPGRQLNLNRVLMERLIHQRSGTRSADGTPVSLRRNGTLEYNGKYLKNPHVSKLINSNVSLMDKKGFDEKLGVRYDSPILNKKRSNSVSGYNPPLPPKYPSPPVRHKNNLDKDGDLKYRKLIQEAEHILEEYHPYMSPTLSTKSAIVPNSKPKLYSRYPNASDIKSQINLLEETINNNPLPKLENEEGILKTISKTLEKIMIRNSESKKNDKDKRKNTNNLPEMYSETDCVNNAILFEGASCTDRNDNLYRGTFTTFTGGSPNPQNRPKPNLMLWAQNALPPPPPLEDPLLSASTPKTPLVPFKSFSLGHELAGSQYCPHSEPVKRKVYSGSSTYGKLQKTLMRAGPEPDYDNIAAQMSTDALRDENSSLKEKVEQLRRERLQVEARVRHTQAQIDRLRLTETSSHC